MGVTVVTSDATIQVNTSQKVISVAPSGWDDQVAEYGRGYHYPIASQTTGFKTGDEPDIETTIFAPVRVANSLKVHNSLIDYFTLGNTNSFLNTDRFTDIDGLQIYGDDYIIDNYTGVGIFRIAQAAATFDDAIDAALASTQNGFSDWFLASVSQMFELVNNETNPSFFWSPLNIGGTNLFTSTTDSITTTRNLMFRPGNHASGLIDDNNKTTAQKYLLMRKHF